MGDDIAARRDHGGARRRVGGWDGDETDSSSTAPKTMLEPGDHGPGKGARLPGAPRAERALHGAQGRPRLPTSGPTTSSNWLRASRPQTPQSSGAGASRPRHDEGRARLVGLLPGRPEFQRHGCGRCEGEEGHRAEAQGSTAIPRRQLPHRRRTGWIGLSRGAPSADNVGVASSQSAANV